MLAGLYGIGSITGSASPWGLPASAPCYTTKLEQPANWFVGAIGLVVGVLPPHLGPTTERKTLNEDLHPRAFSPLSVLVPPC